MTMGPYAQHAEPLIKRGYGAVPIIAGTKAPGFYCAGIWVPLLGWQKRYLGRSPSAEDLAAWGKGDAGIGVVGGRASHGLVAVDIDTDDPGIKAAITEVLPETPVKKIGQKGETRFYYGPDITASRSWNIDGRRVCDIIADGRQTVLPPTIHEKTGLPYRWVGPPLDAFDPKICRSCRLTRSARLMPSSPCSAGNRSPLKRVMAVAPRSTRTASSHRTGNSMNLRSSILIAGYPSSDFTSAGGDPMAVAMPRSRTGGNPRPDGRSTYASAIFLSIRPASRISVTAATAAMVSPTRRSTWSWRPTTATSTPRSSF